MLLKSFTNPEAEGVWLCYSCSLFTCDKHLHVCTQVYVYTHDRYNTEYYW